MSDVQNTALAALVLQQFGGVQIFNKHDDELGRAVFRDAKTFGCRICQERRSVRQVLPAIVLVQVRDDRGLENGLSYRLDPVVRLLWPNDATSDFGWLNLARTRALKEAVLESRTDFDGDLAAPP